MAGLGPRAITASPPRAIRIPCPRIAIRACSRACRTCALNRRGCIPFVQQVHEPTRWTTTRAPCPTGGPAEGRRRGRRRTVRPGTAGPDMALPVGGPVRLSAPGDRRGADEETARRRAAVLPARRYGFDPFRVCRRRLPVRPLPDPADLP